MALTASLSGEAESLLLELWEWFRDLAAGEVAHEGTK
jgi:hypothetical protein